MTGKEIEVARQERGWTQSQLAKKIGYSQSMISMIERGERDPGHIILEKIQRALEGSELASSDFVEPEIFFDVPRPPRSRRREFPVRVVEWHRPESTADFVFLRPLSGDALLIAVVDVAGHGVASIPARSYLQGWLRGWTDARSTVPRLEDLILALSHEMRAVRIDAAGFFAIISRHSEEPHTVAYEGANCGLPAPLLIAGHSMKTLESEAGPGRLPVVDRGFLTRRAIVPAPWRLVIATDGLLSRLGMREEREGIRFLRKWQTGEKREFFPEKILSTDDPLVDDELFFAMVWDSWDYTVQWNVSNQEETQRVYRVLEDKCALLPKKKTFNLIQAVAEAVMNVGRHAYSFSSVSGSVRLLVRFEDKGVRVQVEDDGGTFLDPGIVTSELASSSGFGVMNSSVDDVGLHWTPTGGTIVSLYQEWVIED